MSDQWPPSQGYPGYQVPGQPPFPVPAAASSSKAVASLVLGIASLVLCGLFTGIPAMVVARQARREIRTSQGRLDGDGLATAGFVTGLIGTVWMGLAVLLVVGVFVFGGAVQSSFETTCTSVNPDGSSTGTTADCD